MEPRQSIAHYVNTVTLFVIFVRILPMIQGEVLIDKRPRVVALIADEDVTMNVAVAARTHSIPIITRILLHGVHVGRKDERAAHSLLGKGDENGKHLAEGGELHGIRPADYNAMGKPLTFLLYDVLACYLQNARTVPSFTRKAFCRGITTGVF